MGLKDNKNNTTDTQSFNKSKSEVLSENTKKMN